MQKWMVNILQADKNDIYNWKIKIISFLEASVLGIPDIISVNTSKKHSDVILPFLGKWMVKLHNLKYEHQNTCWHSKFMME